MTGVLGIAQLAVGVALGYTIAAWRARHARRQAARTWLQQQHAKETAIRDEARTGIRQIENHLKEAADQ